jgi:preprotein translocase subunit YajC
MQLLYFVFLIFVLLTVIAIFMGARSMEKKRKQLILDEMKIREELANNQ